MTAAGLLLALLLAAPAEPAAPERDTLLKVAREIMGAARYATLSTLAEEGPLARVVDPFPPEEDLAVWIGTLSTTRKVEAVRRDPRVSLLWFDPARQGYATLLGVAEVITNPAEKAKRWKKEWAAFYRDEHRGRDYLLLRVRPVRLEVLSPADGVLNDPKTWRPATLELGPAFQLPVPDGFRTETIPFPLGFAPGLPYRGTEELRFAPGFFQEGAADFWSYAFAWYLEGDLHFDAARLQADLERYFEGLARAVEEKEAVDASATARLRDVSLSAGRREVEGTVSLHEPFATHRRLEIRVKLVALPCPDGHTAVLFQGAPQTAAHPVWSTLAAVTAGFRCAAPTP